MWSEQKFENVSFDGGKSLRKEPDSNCFPRVNEMKHIRNSIFQSNKIRKYYRGLGSLQDKLISLKTFLCA